MLLPMQWKGKENSHAPVAEYDKSTNLLTISVPHGMSQDHFIEFIYFKRSYSLINEESAEIVMVKKLEKDEYPPVLEMELVDGSEQGALFPYAYCNKHGLWRGDALYL